MGTETGQLRVVANEAMSGSAPGGEVNSPGAYIREQRKRRGMSLEQLAVATKIPRGQLELLEQDRFEELPGAVFTKGFLRCCARALELDEERVFALLYEQERELLRENRREHSAPIPTKTVAKPRLGSGSFSRIVGAFSTIPVVKLLSWVIIALLVTIVVLVAFSLANGQLDVLSNS